MIQGRPHGRRLAALAFVVLAACGGGNEHAGAPAEASAASPGDACIARANVEHEKKPNAPDEIVVRHILVKHVGSKNATQGLTRTRGEACLRAQEALDKLKGGEDFTKLVSEYSDSPGASNDGALGTVHRSDLEPAFAAAAFELDPGQMSNVVETPFGFHVIVRTE